MCRGTIAGLVRSVGMKSTLKETRRLEEQSCSTASSSCDAIRRRCSSARDPWLSLAPAPARSRRGVLGVPILFSDGDGGLVVHLACWFARQLPC